MAPMVIRETSPMRILIFWHFGLPSFCYTWVDQTPITAFSLEDNELWLRHLFSLLVQVVVTGYVFLLTLPENKLLVPTLLMFLAGIIKYFERTRALFGASLDRFRESMLKAPDAGPNYAKLMEEYTSKKEAGLPTRIEMTPEPGKDSKPANKVENTDQAKELTELDVVRYAFSERSKQNQNGLQREAYENDPPDVPFVPYAL